MKIKKDFIGMFDILKGIFMLLIVTAHSLNFVNTASYGDTFTHGAQKLFAHTTALIGTFFIFFGYSYRPVKNMRKYIKKQAKAYLFPYSVVVVLATAAVFLRELFTHTGVVGQTASLLFAGIYGAVESFRVLDRVWVGNIVALWFPLTFFFASIIYQYIRKIPNEKISACVIWGASALAVLIPSKYALLCPWTLVQSFAVLGFMEVGRLLKKHKFLYQKNYFTVIFAAVIWCALHIFSKASVGGHLYRFYWVDYFGGICGAYVVLKLYLLSGAATAAFFALLEYIGRYSMWFLYIHAFELLAIPWTGECFGFLFQFASPTAVFFTVNTLRIVLDAVLCVLMNRFYGKYMEKKLQKIS